MLYLHPEKTLPRLERLPPEDREAAFSLYHSLSTVCALWAWPRIYGIVAVVTMPFLFVIMFAKSCSLALAFAAGFLFALVANWALWTYLFRPDFEIERERIFERIVRDIRDTQLYFMLAREEPAFNQILSPLFNRAA